MLALVVVRSDEPLANGAEAAVPHVLGPRVVEIGQPPSRRQEPRRLPVEPGQPGAIQVVERPRADQRVDAGRQSGRLQVAHVAEPEVDPVAEPLQSPAGLLQHGLGGVQPHARAVRQLFQERLQVRPRAAADVDHQPGLRPVVGDQRGGDRAGERQQVGEPVGGGPPPRELGVLPDLRAVLLRGGHEAPPPAVDSMGVGALLNRRVVSAGRVMSSPVTSIAGVRAMADSRPATASGEANRAAARKVPAAAIASPRSSGWTTSLARAGPRVCRAPAPSPLAASSTAARGAEPASRATSPEPMPATSMLAVTARTSVRPRTRATSAAPAVRLAQHPASTPGRRQMRPRGRSTGGENGGSRSSASGGSMQTSAIRAAMTSAGVIDRTARTPAITGPMSWPMLATKFTTASRPTEEPFPRTTCVWLPVQKQPRAAPWNSSQTTNGTTAADHATSAQEMASSPPAPKTSTQSG